MIKCVRFGSVHAGARECGSMHIYLPVSIWWNGKIYIYV